jgi:membrane carboxypeptidase/penicillin-binding protein PbpC
LQLCGIHEKDIPKGPILFSQYDCKKGEFTSTIDASLSLFARETLDNNLDSLTEKHVTNGAIFAIQPLTNEIIIYEGSRDFYSQSIDGQVDIIHAPRQPGSSMKPFLYLMALEKGFNPDNIIIDTVQEYPSFQP